MKIRKIMVGLLACAIFTGGIPYCSDIVNNPVLIAEAENYEGLIYEKYNDHIEIIGCSASDTVIIIPSKIEGLPVTHIGNEAFLYGQSEYIVIPYGVKKIGEFAFGYCKNLKEIIIPDSVISIGAGAFDGCEMATKITISNNTESIENYTFANCQSITEITIPDSVTSVGKNAFAGCTRLEELTIPDSVTSIGGHAFYGTGLTEITVSNPECEMSDAGISEGTTIYGYTNSTAHQYAMENGNEFVSIGYYSGNVMTTTTMLVTTNSEWTATTTERPIMTTTTTTKRPLMTTPPPWMFTTRPSTTTTTTTTVPETTTPPPWMFTTRLTTTTTTTTKPTTTVQKVPTVIPKEISIRANDSKELIVLNCDNPEDIIWISSDEEVAVVENGYVKGLSEGQATIYAIINDVYCECKVTVKPSITKKGDANNDGLIDVADVVAISAYVGNSYANKLDAQCIKNADVHNTGDGITANDALMVQQYIAKIIDNL